MTGPKTNSITGRVTRSVTNPAAQKRILVVEDDSSIRQLMQDVLEEEGYAVTLLCRATNAYDEISRTLPDLVILDITLQHSGDGWPTLDKLKQNVRTADLPVIICSADIRAVHARQEDLIAMDCIFVEKPFGIDTLLTAVQEGLAEKLQATMLNAKQKSDSHLLAGIPA
ncbi:MAG: response regulator [Chloroflexota bacterium]